VGKFKGLFENRTTPEPKPAHAEALPAVVQAPPVIETTPTRGRPKGKRSDPDFEQVTAYIRKDTHRQVKMALLAQGQNREFSELTQALLSAWLEQNT